MDSNQEEYLTVNELSRKIKFAKQTIYNMIHKDIFIQSIHYIKPRPKKILFKWSAVKEWMESASVETTHQSLVADHTTSTPQEKCLINI